MEQPNRPPSGTGPVGLVGFAERALVERDDGIQLAVRLDAAQIELEQLAGGDGAAGQGRGERGQRLERDVVVQR